MTPFGPGFMERSSLTTCGTSGQTSCHNTTVQTNLCCFESPGGLIVQTQFWDTNPVTGPANSWTIHGLWPDHCDGTFSSSCDPSRFYSSITNILNNAGRSDLVNYMTTYMVSNSESPELFWEHEWNTHGTCYSTLGPSCISPSGGQDAVDYFNTIVNLFQTLPTYTWLANAGILPDSSATHTLSALTSALSAASGGFAPALYCTSGSLSQIYWYFNLKGSLVDGAFVPISAPIAGSCPSSGITYLPKNGATTTTPTSSATHTTSTTTTTTTTATATTTTTTTTTTTSTGTAATGVPTSATIKATSGTGCLLSHGTWSTQTCATYHITSSGSSLTMTTSKGPCGVVNGVLTCGSGVTASTFGATNSGSTLLLTYSGSTAFSASGIPSGTIQETVYIGNVQSVQLTFAIV